MDTFDAQALGEAFCSFPPTSQEWFASRDVFLGLSKPHGYGLRALPEKFGMLERELERSYCGRNYVACVLLAVAMIETLDALLTKEIRERLRDELDYAMIRGELAWLQMLRNNIAHANPNRNPNPIPSDEYIFNKPALEEHARHASAIAFRFAFGYTRFA
ncbi:MAG: hypothetical protein ACREVG_11460 [Burkholderiales bacterium]